MSENPNQALWDKYGLSTPPPGVLMAEEHRQGLKAHNLLVAYLEAHPDIARDYRCDQTGEIGYYDVLILAEKEERARVKTGDEC